VGQCQAHQQQSIGMCRKTGLQRLAHPLLDPGGTLSRRADVKGVGHVLGELGDELLALARPDQAVLLGLRSRLNQHPGLAGRAAQNRMAQGRPRLALHWAQTQRGQALQP